MPAGHASGLMSRTAPPRGRMHPDPPQHDVTRDPILDGRDSLRLVKLRLALTLITVAILPIAAVAPLLRAIADEGRVAHHLRLETEASAASTAVDHEVGAIVASGTQLSTDPLILAAVAPTAVPADRAAAGSRLGQVMTRPSAAVVGSAVVEGSTVVASWGTVIALPGGQGAGVSLAPSAGDGSAMLLVTSGGSGKGQALVVTTISLPVLLAWAMPDQPIPGESVYVSDSTGNLVAVAQSGFNAAAIPGQVLDLAADTTSDADGSHPLGVAGLDGWTIGVSAPIPLAALPMPAIASLAGMIVLLIGFTLWMARQILRPAAQLEASRSRLRELYESAREAALRDSLTGLGNHRAFQEAVARMGEG
ncbi:MAG TPA: hypothetical protein VET90_05065, partial [Candidatus Binatus sp.]|nr:hypothetical protein [Candidatus Binatus sp.]